MSHAVTVRANGRAEAAFYAERAWHGLGKVVTDAITVAEMFILAGLDWTVSTVEAYSDWTGPDGAVRRMMLPNQFVTRRDDTGEILGVVSQKYPTFQNWQARDLLTAVFGEEKVAETMFSLEGGKRVVMTIDLGRDSIALGRGRKDEHRLFLLLSIGHTGTDGILCSLVKERVVCANTYAIAIAEDGGKETITIRHSQKMGERVETLIGFLRSARESNELFNGKLRSMVKAKLTDEQRAEFFEQIIDKIRPQDVKARKLAEKALAKALTAKSKGKKTITVDDMLAADAAKDAAKKVMTEEGEDTELVERRRAEILTQLESAWAWEVEENKVPASQYAAFQAASSVVEHFGTYRGSAQDRAEAEFDSRLYGKAAGVKQSAFVLLDAYNAPEVLDTAVLDSILDASAV